MRRRVVPVAGTVLLALVVGCGGYHAASSGARARGRATIHVRWPSGAARLIPASAQSLVVTITKDGQAVGTTRIVRPSATGTVTGLPYGTLGVVVKAYANTGGTGVVQAVGAGTMVVTEDVPGTAAVAPDSTVATLELSGAPLSVVRGGTVSVFASAKDASGAIVPLSTSIGAESLVWTVTPTSVATLAGTGPTVRVTGVATGDATVAATLKVKDDGTTVATVDTPLHVSDPLMPSGLPGAGYPVIGGEYGASGQSHGPSAAGTVGVPFPVGDASGSGTTSVVTGPDGTVYTVANTKILVIGATGPVLWTVDTNKAVSGLALSGSGELFVSTATGLEARRADTGALLWNFDLGSATLSPPAVGGDGTVFAFTPSKLYALNAADGTVRWSQSVALTGRLAIGPDGALYGHNGTNVIAFDPATGTTRWNKPAYKTDDEESDVSVVGDAVYLVSGTTKTSTVRSTGFQYEGNSVIGTVEGNTLASPPPESAFVTSGRLVTGGTAAGTNSTNGTNGTLPPLTWYRYRTVVALNAADGSLRWASELPKVTVTLTGINRNIGPTRGYLRAAPAVANGRVVAQAYGCVVGLNAATGAQSWIVGAPSLTPTTYSQLLGISLTTNGVAYVARYDSTTTDGSVLQAVDAATGAVRWRAALTGTTFGFPTVADDGVLYVGTTNGKVVPIR